MSQPEMQNDPHAVQIFVDGSCFLHRNRESGYAGFVLYPDSATEQEIVFHGVKESTINRMELAACIAALEWIRDTRPRTARIQIFSDSSYVIHNVPRARYWKQNKWRNYQGRPVENVDLWKDFLSLRGKISLRVDFGLVKGKSNVLLKKIDKAARAAAESGTAIDRGYRLGKIGRATKRGGSATMFPAAGQILTLRVYRSALAGKTSETKVMFETYDEVTGSYGPKYYAYAPPEIAGELHRQRAFRVEMNMNAAYPQILDVREEVPLPGQGRKKASSVSAPPKSSI